MDAFLFKQNDASVVKDAILSQLVLAVKEVQTNVEPSESNSDNTASFLLTVIEAMFIHSLKETLMNKMSQVMITDVGQRPDPNFWAPLLIFSHRDVISQISSLSQVTTDVGRGRAWLRLALNEGLLSSYLHSMATDNKSLKPYYNNNAFLRDNEKLDLAQQLIEGIEICKFSLVCNSSLLNVWTNMPLLMAAVSTGPLRSCPVVPGTDVALTLLSEETSEVLNTTETTGISIYNFTDHMKPSRLMVDEEEALKIILGTPVNDSPLQAVRVNDSPNYEKETEALGDCSVQCGSGDGITRDDNVVVLDSAKQKDIPKPSESKNLQTVDEPVREELKSNKPVISTSQQSYNSLIISYNTVSGISSEAKIKDVVQRHEESLENELKQVCDVTTSIMEQHCSEMSCANSGFDFEVVPVASTFSHIIPEYTTLVQYLSTLARDHGLDAQKYICSFCKHPVGVHLENVRFTGEYYCKECYGHPPLDGVIPARVLHNWDFRRYPLSQRADKFLTEIQDHPLLDLKAINPRLYVVNEEMAHLQRLRMQLNLLRAYLFTCRQPVGEELKKQIWPKEYLYEHVHLYSVSDLMKIPNGVLIQILEKSVTFSRHHVLNCSLCKQKGFFCEICSADTVIYPFDLDSTYKCSVCSAVFHAECHNSRKPCPKCDRQKKRQQQELPYL